MRLGGSNKLLCAALQTLHCFHYFHYFHYFSAYQLLLCSVSHLLVCCSGRAYRVGLLLCFALLCLLAYASRWYIMMPQRVMGGLDYEGRFIFHEQVVEMWDLFWSLSLSAPAWDKFVLQTILFPPYFYLVLWSAQLKHWAGCRSETWKIAWRCQFKCCLLANHRVSRITQCRSDLHNSRRGE